MNFFWAAVYCAYKIIGQDLPATGITGGIVTLRFGLAGLCLLFAWHWLPGPAPRGKDLVTTFGMGLMLFVVGQRLQVYGNQLGTAGNSAILMAFEPIVTSLSAALLLREHIGPRRWAGFGLGLCGVALLHGVWRPGFQWTGLQASLIFISSFICEALFSVMGKPVIMRASVVKMLALALLFGTGVNLLVDGSATMHFAAKLSPRGWLLIVGLAVICTAVGYSFWFLVIRESPINVAALTVFSQSVFGVALAALWLGERVGWDQLAGCATIIAGLVIGLSRQIRPHSQI